MKQVFEQYGSSVIAVLLASCILTVVLGGTVFLDSHFDQLLGQLLTYSVDGKGLHANPAFQDYMSSKPPVITQQENVFVVINQRVLLSDIFEAKSQSGQLLPLYLTSAWSRNGEEVDIGVSSDRTSICVSEAGVYWVQLYAIDEKQKQTSVRVKLLVNAR